MQQIVQGGLQVACFKHIPASDATPDRWIYADTRRPHTHDVRAMLTVTPPGADPLLLTGGDDAQLIAFSVPHFQTVGPPWKTVWAVACCLWTHFWLDVIVSGSCVSSMLLNLESYSLGNQVPHSGGDDRLLTIHRPCMLHDILHA